MNKTLALLALCAAAAMPAITLAQFAKPEAAIKYRQSTMTIQGQHFGQIAAVVRGGPYDPAETLASALVIEQMTKLHGRAFGPGTDAGAPTRALPAVWSEPDKFKAGAKKLMEGAGKLVEAAKTNDLEQVKAAFGPLGQTCKGCHDAFRKE